MAHGRKKEHYSSYLAEFIWHYVNHDKDLFQVFLKDVVFVYKLQDFGKRLTAIRKTELKD